MTAAVPGAVRGRPSAARLSARVDAAEARADTLKVEVAARRQEDVALAAALRFVARSIEALAFDPRGDMRQAPNAARLHGIADKVAARAAA